MLLCDISCPKKTHVVQNRTQSNAQEGSAAKYENLEQHIWKRKKQD
jgi:hypothetical protein